MSSTDCSTPDQPSAAPVLDLRPHPGAAPTARRVRSAARIETLLLVRNGEQLLLALVIPLAVLLGGRFAGARMGLPFATLAPSVWGLAIWSTAFSAVAIATGFDRRYGVLERLAASPLGRGGLLAGKALAALTVIAGQLLVLVGISVLLGWRPDAGPAAWALAVVAAVLAICCFTALGLAMAGTLRAEITLALANLVYLVGAALGLVLPASSFGPAGRLVALLPTAALGDSLRALGTGALPGAEPLVLLVWAIAAALVARKVFRWIS